MTSIAKALYAFYSGFGLPAYPEDGVPSDEEDGVPSVAKLPYITYTIVQPDFIDSALHQARVWYQSESYVGVNAKADEIIAAVGRGLLLPAGDGAVCLRPGTPLAQPMPIEGKPEIKVVYLNFQLNAYLTQGV